MSTQDGPSRSDAGTRQVARGGFANLVGAAYSGAATFAVTALVTRISSTGDAGVYFSAVSILLIAVAIAQLGVPVGYVYFLSRFRGLARADLLRPTLTAGAVPILAIGIPLTALAIAFREQLGTLLLGSHVDGRATIIAILASTLLVAIAGEGLLAATRGLGAMRPTVIVDKFLNPTVQLVALVLLALAGWTGSQELVWTRVVGFIVVSTVALPWLTRVLLRFPAPVPHEGKRIWFPDRATSVEFWRFTAPRALGQVAQVGIQRVDIVLVALWLSPTEAAIYAAATRFLVFGQLAAAAINVAVQPRISTLNARGETGALQDLYRISTVWIMLATWPLYLVFIVSADLLMRVFGADYAAGAVVLKVLSASMLVATGCGAVDSVLLMAGRSTLTMINAWAALVVNVALNIWLIPAIGIMGAALAWVAALIAKNVVPLIQVRASLGIHPFGRTTLAATVVTGGLFGLLPWAIASAGGGATGAIIHLMMAVPVYSAFVWRMRESLGMNGLFNRKTRQ